MKKTFFLFLLISVLFLSACKNTDNKTSINTESKTGKTVVERQTTEIAQNKPDKNIAYYGKAKSIHILVALCDNEYQGIVPAPKNLGNGQKPQTNLYWGAAYGIKSFFKRSKEWKLLKSKHLNDTILERLIFKHKTKNYYLVADAYNGKYIKQTTIDFLKNLSGQLKDTLHINGKTIGINGNARLLSYIGHDGLMNFDLEHNFKNKDGQSRDAIILACISKDYFYDYLKEAGARPLVWTTGLMAPEAYTVHDAISAYVNGESETQIRLKAAQAYSKYQKCSLRATKNLLVSGW